MLRHAFGKRHVSPIVSESDIIYLSFTSILSFPIICSPYLYSIRTYVTSQSGLLHLVSSDR